MSEGVKVKDVMIPDVIALSPEETIGDAVGKFAKHNITGCPVIDNAGHIIGIMTETDILNSLKTYYRELKMKVPPETIIGISFVEIVKKREAAEAFEEIANTLVRDAMNRNLITAGPEDELEDVIQKMVKNDVNRIPIVDNGAVVGIVTRGDVIRAVQKMPLG